MERDRRLKGGLTLEIVKVGQIVVGNMLKLLVTFKNNF